MTTTDQHEVIATPILNEFVGTKSGLLCSCCYNIKYELEETQSELKTASEIIKLLQEEIKYMDTYATSMATMETNDNSITTVEENNENFNKWKQSTLKRQNFKNVCPVQHTHSRYHNYTT